MICVKNVRRYCREYQKIENYEEAVKSEEVWVVHHKKEDEGYSLEQLKKMGLYYNRQPEELIFMSMIEHSRHHSMGNSYALGNVLSEETKRKMSDAQKGHTVSEKTREIFKNRMLGEKNPMYGKHHTEEAKQILKEKNGGGNNKRALGVVQIDKNTKKVVKIWDCITTAGKELEITRQKISACCKGKISTFCGYIWMYYSDWLNANSI